MKARETSSFSVPNGLAVCGLPESTKKS